MILCLEFGSRWAMVPGSGLELPGDTGTVTYDLQEGVHETITDLTGISVDHSYIGVEVEGEPVLAVDPPMPMFLRRNFGRPAVLLRGGQSVFIYNISCMYT